MERMWRVGLLVMITAAMLVGCSGGASKQAKGQPTGAPYELDGPLTVRAYDKDRVVEADSDETFDFLVVNNTAQSLPVVFVLEHSDGQRWRTSLCVDKQCLLGDGSEPSVTEPFVLPPYLEQPFQAHLFVDKAALPGHQSSLTLRVEPQLPGIAPQSLTLSGQLASD